MDNIIRKMCEIVLLLINRKKKTHYGDELQIPFFKSSVCSDKTLVDSLKGLKSTPGPLVIENGEIMSCDERCLSDKIPCYILAWSSDIEKGWLSRGLGFYYGSSTVITAKHVLEGYEKINIYVLFPTHEYCLIYNGHRVFPENLPIPFNHDIAFIELQGCFNPLQNIKSEIGELSKAKMLYFNILESGCFVKRFCNKAQPNSNMNEQMLPYEFVLSKAGKKGDSGTPIYSDSGKCVGLYIGVFTETNNLLEYGRGLQFENIFHN